ncbi:adhesin [Streptomyces anulatus]|uniref:adhesin n=1 Tax=Streptomyces TaxID=1883 RepID=UPI00225456A9|nr:adhesin [Streptomyces anulatus]MCX4485307.1 adhesin [Streptomyces anulatus]WSU78657.1 adhesin [Streptomyces anulatus]WTD14972.1 adhesin [Streptomyces anulatus]WTE08282.1 adhesin [Streptomyces anulatus]
MVCPGCGAGASRVPGTDGSWVVRETLTGRLSTLSRRRRALLAAGVVVVAGGLVTVATLVVQGGGSVGGGSTRTDAAGRAGALPDRVGGAAPTRLGPGADTEVPGAPRGTPPGPSASPGDGRRFTQWAGPGCAAGTYREAGRFASGEAGWYTVDSGGFDGGGCDGRFSAVPMSGSPAEDRGSTATWSWRLGRGFSECALTVFVPGSGSPRDAAGDPTVYRVLSDPDDPDSAYTGFAVDQTEHRGSAVPVRSYPVKGDVFAVQLIDRGRDWGDAKRVGAHHAAAQMKASCH